MTLNAKIGCFMDFLAVLGCKTFQEWIAPKQIKIDRDKLHMKFSTLNVDFDGPSLNFLGSRKPAHEGVKAQYPRKSHHFTVVDQCFVKMIADHDEHAAYHNKH